MKIQNFAARLLKQSHRWPAAALVGVATIFGGGIARAQQPPNVLFISVDDLNDWVGCLGGHPQTKTPNIDRLAASGVLFTNAYCAAPVCNPSRSAIMTGLPPAQSGIYNNDQRMRDALPDAVIIPKYFSQHGYWSAGSGKILHYFVDANSWDQYFPEKSKEDPFPRTAAPEVRPVSLPSQPWKYVAADWAKLDMGDEDYGGDYLVSQWVGDQLKQPHAKPFFLACGIYKPHEPWYVPKKYFEPFPLESIQPGPGYKADDLDDVPPAGQKLARNRYFEYIQQQGKWKDGIQAYLASIHYADAMVGRVLAALDASPYRDNTIVVLWSDHGWHLGEKEHWQKYTGWRLGARVPLIIRVPPGVPGLKAGTTQGTICNRPVSLVDLYRTLIELCGLPKKKDISGQSLVPLLKDPTRAWDETVVTHLSTPGDFAVSTESWRYIHYKNGDEELYNITADPHEWKNLAPVSGYAAELAHLRTLSPKNPKPAYESQPGIGAIQTEDFLGLVAAKAGKIQCPPSQTGGVTVNVIFRNQTNHPMQLFSVDEKGARHFEHKIFSASRYWVRTTAGRTWLICREDGTDFGYFVTEEKSAIGSIQTPDD